MSSCPTITLVSPTAISAEIDDLDRENSKTRKAVMDITADLNERKSDKGRDEPSKYELLMMTCQDLIFGSCFLNATC